MPVYSIRLVVAASKHYYMAIFGHFHWPIVPCETAALNDDWSSPRVKVLLCVRQRHLSERGGKAKSPMNLGCIEHEHNFWWWIQNPRLKWRGMVIGLMLMRWFWHRMAGWIHLIRPSMNIMIFALERQQMNNVLPVRGHSAGKSCNARLPHDTHALHLVNGYSWRQNIIKHDNFLQ